MNNHPQITPMDTGERGKEKICANLCNLRIKIKDSDNADER